MIKGYDSRGKNYTGLLEKCPALSFTDRTVTMNDEEGVSVRRRTEAFTWSRDIYRQWMNGGACWLDPDPQDDDHNDGEDDDDKGRDNNKGNDKSNNVDAKGSFTASQHSYSNFTAPAVNQNDKTGAPGSRKEEDCTNNPVQREGNLQQNRNMQKTKIPEKVLISHSMILKML